MNDRDAPFLRTNGRRKHSLFAHAVDELGSRIVRGDLKPGTTLPNEADVGRELGVSRSVVREAVKSLAAKGLLEPRARIGTRILEPRNWNLLDLDVLSWRYASMPRTQFFRELFEIRRMIEPPAAAVAAERADADDLAEMRAAYAEMESADQTSDRAIDADLRFHRSILAGTHNELLMQMGGIIGVGLLVSFRISHDSYGVSLLEHRDVLDAIRDRAPARAAAAMEQLLAHTRRFLESELADAADAAAAGAALVGSQT
jgi:DNA-binding FadR family transcriptional regulator